VAFSKSTAKKKEDTTPKKKKKEKASNTANAIIHPTQLMMAMDKNCGDTGRVY
jgi:hypothetical protein